MVLFFAGDTLQKSHLLICHSASRTIELIFLIAGSCRGIQAIKGRYEGR